MAFPLALIPLVTSMVSSGVGAKKEGDKRREMTRERERWNAENEAIFNKDYYSDYTQRADVQNIIRQMREEMKRQSKIDQSSQAVLGTTAESVNASKERRNKAMATLYGNLAAQGQLKKDRDQQRYLTRRYGLQGLEYDTLGKEAQSSNNLLYNGLKSAGNTDWASVVGGWKKSDAGSVVDYDYTTGGSKVDPSSGLSWG